MKKTLIAAAVAAAVAAPAANAGVTIYGTIHMSIDYLDYENSRTGVPGGVWEVNSRTSKLGFKGSEDLGNGLKAIWKVENTLRMTDTGNGSLNHWGGARNAYIGLAGDWGTFLYGRHDTPYKMAYYASGIDMLGDSFMDTNALYGHQEWRRDDAIAYVSPNWNGLTIAAAVIPGETTEYDSFADSYSLGLMYSNNGLKLSAGYEDTQGEVGADSQNWMVGAGYSMNALDISAVYVDQEVDGTFDMTSYAVSMAYTMGNNKLIGTVGQSDWDTGDGTAYGIAVQHMFSKRTSAYLGYSSSEMLSAHKTQTDSDYGTADAGFDFRGTDSEAVSFGMIHKF